MNCPNKNCNVELILIPYKDVDGIIKKTYIHPVIQEKCQYAKDGISIYVDDPILNNAFNQIVQEAEEKRINDLKDKEEKNLKLQQEAIEKAKLKEQERINNLWYNRLFKYLLLK